MSKGIFTGIAALIALALVFALATYLAGVLYSTESDGHPSYEIEVGAEEGDSAETAEEISLEEAMAQADPNAGERVFRKCAACHALEQGEHGVGPSLFGIVGKDIASAPGYIYSDALTALEGTWNFGALAEYINDPRRYAPGTTMGFSGLRKPEDRASLILFLLGHDGPQSNPSLGLEEPVVEQEPVVEPEPAPDPVDLIEDQLKSADLAFNRPDVMHLGQATSVELVLSPDTAPRVEVSEDATPQQAAEAIGLSSDLPGETRFVENVQYALQMEAEISGLGFDVHPPGPQRQTVLPGMPAKWVWTVEPKSAGSEQIFTVNVNAIIQRDGTDLPPVRIKTFTERIMVEVSLWQGIIQYAKDLTALNGAIVGIGGTLIAVLGWFWARLRKKKKAAAPKPAEVIVTHRIDDGA